MFKSGFEFGFGLAIGYIVGIAVLDTAAKRIRKVINNKAVNKEEP